MCLRSMAVRVLPILMEEESEQTTKCIARQSRAVTIAVQGITIESWIFLGEILLTTSMYPKVNRDCSDESNHRVWLHYYYLH